MNTTGAFIYLIGTLIDLYITAVMLRLLLQWVRADFYNPVCQFLVVITNPLLIPLRRVVPSIGRLDTASVVLMIVLELLGVSLVTWPPSICARRPASSNGPACWPSIAAKNWGPFGIGGGDACWPPEG